MPRYFFNILGKKNYTDPHGEELADKRAAWKEATIMAGKILQDMDGDFQPGHTWQLEVTDEFANPLVHIRMHAENRK
jgi:hypothetical protein